MIPFGRRLAAWGLMLVWSILLYWLSGTFACFLLPLVGIAVFFGGRRHA